MRMRLVIFCLMLSAMAAATYGLEPNEILIIANSDIKESVKLAEYYCAKRGVPKNNIFALALGKSLDDKISRSDYEKKLAKPIYDKLNSPEFFGKIRCLLTTYGVPIKVGGRGELKEQKDNLKKLEELVEQEKRKLEQLEHNVTSADSRTVALQKKRINQNLARLRSRIDFILGKETDASVDSELSMVLFGNYELYRWQPNELTNRWPYTYYNTVMVCRLDGPGFEIAKSLIDKSLAAEKNGLKGIAYIDSGYSITTNKDDSLFAEFDKSLCDLAEIIRSETRMPVVEERTEALFKAGQCPSTAIYCGWYSLKKYIDSFDFVDGAIGYHIASWEAVNLRDPNSSQWCPAMLKHGVTATLGAVDEPYLHAFPRPKEFFKELFDGHCLVEAFYHTNPFNSWRLVLIGDPLYNPFKISVKISSNGSGGEVKLSGRQVQWLR
jgi:uncharacterized protein (TIGR03790 family)